MNKMYTEKNDYENPLITVVTVCFNSGKTIEKTLISVLNQTYSNYEYLVIDGASTDNTLEVLEKYQEKFCGKLRVISEKDKGIYDAMNKGIKNSTGKIIGILNSDDYYSDNTLELVAQKYAETQHEYVVINGDMERVSEKDELIYRYHFTENQIKNKEYFGHPSMFAAKAVYDRIGLYNQEYKLAADGEWQYRVHEDEDVKYVLCSEVFSHMREGGASDNPKYAKQWFKERVKMKLEYNKGGKFSIYKQECFAAVKTCIKAVMPKKLQSLLYDCVYSKKSK
ncbi:MAG: glycosyltransferase [Ruminococcaceae bacterium]|nr:glycosyltransferase [Oscillospiraceae bacterium]